MSTPHKCPKCNGIGFLQYDPNNPFSDITGTSTENFGKWHCNVCQSGIIWTHEPLDMKTAIKQAALNGEDDD